MELGMSTSDTSKHERHALSGCSERKRGSQGVSSLICGKRGRRKEATIGPHTTFQPVWVQPDHTDLVPRRRTDNRLCKHAYAHAQQGCTCKEETTRP